LPDINLIDIIKVNGPGTYLLFSCRVFPEDELYEEYQKIILEDKYKLFFDLLSEDDDIKNKVLFNTRQFYQYLPDEYLLL